MAENPREGSLEARLRLRRVLPTRPVQLLQLLEKQLAGRPRAAALRLELRGGQSLQGELVRYHAQENTLLLSQQGALNWVEVAAVEAIALLDAESWLNQLTESPEAEESAAPTRLALRRQGEQLAGALAPARLSISWDCLPEDDRSARQLQQTLKDLGTAWQRLGADEMGRAALRSVEQLELAVTSGAGGVQREGPRLAVALTRGPEGLLEYPFKQLLSDLERLF